MTKHPIAHEWQRAVWRDAEERRLEDERRRRERIEREFAEARLQDLPFRNDGNKLSISTTIMGSLHDDSDHESNILEQPNFSTLPEVLPTPPASPPFDASTDDLVVHLQHQIKNQGTAIEKLESELQCEQGKVRHLQAARHEAVSAQKEAILAEDYTSITREKKKVSDLLDMLKESENREKELEHQVDEGRKRELELKRQLLDAQTQALQHANIPSSHHPNVATDSSPPCIPPYEKEEPPIWVTRLRRVESLLQAEREYTAQRRHQHEEYSALSSNFGEDVYTAQKNQSPALRSGRSRQQARQMERYGYIDMPKKGGGRKKWIIV